MSDIKIQYWDIEKIIPYANNPRDNKKAIDAVAKSLRKFGVRSPAIVDRDGVLIAGHTRILAAQKIGLRQFPVVVADDLTPGQVKAYRIMDNRAQEESAWDGDLLGAELSELQAVGFDMSETGFSPFEIESFTFDPLAAAEPDDEYPEEYPTDADTESGPAGEYGYMYTADDPELNEEPAGTYHPEDFPQTHKTAAPAADDGPYEPVTNLPFVCILCCNGDEEKQYLSNLIREPDELKNRYTMAEILERLQE